MDDKKHTARAWFGFAEPFNWQKARSLGPLISVVATLIVGGLFILAIAAAFKLLWTAVFGEMPQDGFAKFGLTGIIVAMIGAPFVVWRSVVAQKQVNVAEQGMITDRLNKAVEGLGAEKTVNKLGRDISYQIDGEIFRDFEFQNEAFELPKNAANIQRTAWSNFTLNTVNLEVRTGAIYALERISRDSLRDHIQIMEILCAYVRENASCVELTPEVIPNVRANPRLDIQTIITVLGRRSKSGMAIERDSQYRLDLRSCDLSGVNFEKGNFSAALFQLSKFEYARFDKSELVGCKMYSANIRYASFWDTNLTGAALDHVTASPSNRFNSLNRARLTGTCLFGADLSAVYMKSTLEKYPTIGSIDTKFSGFKETELAKHFEALDKIEFIDASEELGRRKSLDVGGLNFWSPFDSSDGASFQLLAEARNELGLVGWLAF